MPHPPLRVIVIGAGIAGLCTSIGLAKSGHEVIVLESARQLSPVGGGIHVPPNATLVLQRWGILHRFESIAIAPAGFSFRRYANSAFLATNAPSPATHKKPRTPYWSMKRSDYQQVLHDIAIELGIVIKLGHRVTHINEALPAAHIQNTIEPLPADLIIIADGIKSTLRQQMLPNDDVSAILQPYETYRGWAPSSIFACDPSIKSLFSTPSSNVWIGPNRHIIIYPASQGEILTINGTHPARANTAAEWNRPASIEQIQHSFKDFDPIIQEILAKIHDCKAYSLAEVPRLGRWTSTSGKVVLIGDAAHGMLQFLAQGAAMAVEDAAALTECVDRVRNKEDITHAMSGFERSRKWRCERVQAQARRNGEFIHIPDGEEQEVRDRNLMGIDKEAEKEAGWGGKVDTGPFFDEGFMEWLYGFDVFEHTQKVLDAAGLHCVDNKMKH